MAQRGYDAASLDYRAASEKFWGFLSRRTVERMSLKPGARVLDVACGPGVSTIAAAQRVGPEGSVVAFDSSEQMLRMTTERASSRGFENVETVQGDMARMDFPSGSFDAVISVLGVFFVPDMPSVVKSLWRLVAPGGQLAITTLGRGGFEPALGMWKDAVRKERPDATLAFSWERTEDPNGVRELLVGAGVERPTTQAEQAEIPISGADEWWLAVMGSEMRRTVLELDPEATGRVFSACERGLHRAGVRGVQVPGVYALGTRLEP